MLDAINLLSDALTHFHARNTIVRGRQVDFIAISIATGGYQLQAEFAPRDNGMPGIAQSIIQGSLDYAVCDFVDAEELVAVLNGDSQPEWLLSDE